MRIALAQLAASPDRAANLDRATAVHNLAVLDPDHFVGETGDAFDEPASRLDHRRALGLSLGDEIETAGGEGAGLMTP